MTPGLPVSGAPDPTPVANTPPAATGSPASATAPKGGADLGGSNLPGVFGDLFGGAAVPVAVGRFDAQGNAVGQVFSVRDPQTGRYTPLTRVNAATHGAITGQYSSARPASRSPSPRPSPTWTRARRWH